MEYKITRVMLRISFVIIVTATVPLGYAYVWSPDMRLTWNFASDWMPSMAQASDGKLWVVWHSYRTGNADIFYKVYDAAQVHPWSSETGLTTDLNVDVWPSIMRAKDGTLWVVWSTNRNGNYDIYYKVYDGVSWSPEDNLTADPNEDEFPSIMQTANGAIWLSWSTNRTGNYDIYYKTSNDNGTTWSPDTPLPVANPAANDWDPSITETADGKIWVVWVRNYNIFYKTSNDNGTTWSSDNAHVTDPSSDWHPSIMQAEDGKIWVVWDSDRISGQNDIFYKIRDGFWSLDQRLTTDLSDDSMPSIMQTTNQSIWIVWTSSRVSNIDIYYRTTEIPQPHDVNIFSVTSSKAAVYQGQTVSIEAVAQNHGTSAETFTVRCYGNSTLMGSQTINLAPGQLYPTSFPWNTSTTAIGTYTISAQASVVEGETNTDDNTFIDSTVQVKIPGDVNGDGKVEDSDLLYFSETYESEPGDPNWNLECDFNGDNKVDASDLFDLSKNYGKSS